MMHVSQIYRSDDWGGWGLVRLFLGIFSLLGLSFQFLVGNVAVNVGLGKLVPKFGKLGQSV